MATLNLVNINKIYPNGVQAVFDLNLSIKDKEFIVLVGPSGCGKSTTLRMIAGLEDISSGELYIDDKRMNDVSSKDRGIAMVFQSYALYPHMTVFDNMAFALQLRRIERDEITKRVNVAAKILGLEPLLGRYPRQLSGGQCQRVALGRAIVRNAKIFLMDEPLSNLDAKLRVTMRGELIKLSKKLGCTTVYVTHDQIEAMTMADRIVVMKDGEVQQIGTPEEVYETPVNVFVGGFIGTPPMNFIHGTIDSLGDFVSSKGKYKLTVGSKMKEVILNKGYINKNVILGIRPEDISDNIENIKNNPNFVVNIVVELSELLGSNTNVYTNIDDDTIVASLDARDDIHRGSSLKLLFDMNHCHLFDAQSELNITK